MRRRRKKMNSKILIAMVIGVFLVAGIAYAAKLPIPVVSKVSVNENLAVFSDGTVKYTGTMRNPEYTPMCRPPEEPVMRPIERTSCTANNDGTRGETMCRPPEEPVMRPIETQCATTENSDGTYTTMCRPPEEPVMRPIETKCATTKNSDGTYTTKCRPPEEPAMRPLPTCQEPVISVTKEGQISKRELSRIIRLRESVFKLDDVYACSSSQVPVVTFGIAKNSKEKSIITYGLGSCEEPSVLKELDAVLIKIKENLN
ncbi:hypothetical protein KY308_02020 [Candidatus Woesearchaeota archaeon]|nr:hypothetical protein [Candidatus Woesearchaeota archaeon]